MATTLATLETREVLRCERCQLVQFRGSGGNCRRCRKPLELDEPLPLPAPMRPVIAPAREEADVAAAVRSLRREKGLSQRQLANRMEVPRTYISKIENAKALPTLSSLQRLAAALGTPMTALLRDGRSRRADALLAVSADPWTRELLPLAARLSPFQQQLILRHARDMARETVSGRPRLARA